MTNPKPTHVDYSLRNGWDSLCCIMASGQGLMRTLLGSTIAVLASSLVLLIGCDSAKQSDDLTRDRAAELLRYYVGGKTQVLYFSKSGLYAAEKDGVMKSEEGPGISRRYEFTELGMAKMRGYISNKYCDNFCCGIDQAIEEQMGEVTGITDGLSPSTKIVVFNTIYALPPHLKALRLFRPGHTKTAEFRKYDDGWRFERITEDRLSE